LIWHETAHEWWGNNITAKDMADLWIHEAFATYAEVMVTEFFEGKKAAQKLLSSQAPQNKNALIGSYGVNDFRVGDVYAKGCLILHTLRNIIDNDSTGFLLLRSLQQHFRYQTVATEDIVGFINKTLGKDLGPFFDHYLRHAPLPELQLKFAKMRDGLEVQYRWNADVRGFHMPVKVTTAKNRYEFIYPETEWKKMVVKGMKEKEFKVDEGGFLVKVKVVKSF
jgi:aminopeptidase N